MSGLNKLTSENNSLGFANAGVPVSNNKCLHLHKIGDKTFVRLASGFFK